MSDSAPTPPPRKAAVALRYDRGADAAPVIVAAGKGRIAEKIEERARLHGVPVKEEGALANALVTLDVGQEIPPELYKAVAEVLAFVYRLQADQR